MEVRRENVNMESGLTPAGIYGNFGEWLERIFQIAEENDLKKPWICIVTNKYGVFICSIPINEQMSSAMYLPAERIVWNELMLPPQDWRSPFTLTFTEIGTGRTVRATINAPEKKSGQSEGNA